MTSNNLPTIFNNIRQNQIPDFVKEPKSLLSFISFGKGNLFQEFENIIAASSQPNYARQLRGAMYQLLDDKTPVYQLSAGELLERIKNMYPLSSVSEYYYPTWILALMNHHWVRGDRHLIIRLLTFFMGYKTEHNFHYQKQLLDNMPDEYQLELGYQLEIFALTFMATCKKNNPKLCFQSIHYFSTQFTDIQPIIEKEKPFLLEYMEKELEMDFGGYLSKSVMFVDELRDALEDRYQQLEWKAFSSFDWTSLELIKDFKIKNNEFKYHVLKVLKIVREQRDFFKNTSRKIEEFINNFMQEITWTETLIKDYLDFLRQTQNFEAIPTSLENTLQSLHLHRNIPDDLSKILWDYYIFLKSSHRKNKVVWDIIRTPKVTASNDEKMHITWEDKLKSGFHPVPIPTRHNPYHGAHPDQIRPMFQLLNAVAKVDIIKFYQVNKLYRMRFLFEGERHDVATGDGFGTGCVNNLNTLLFEHKIPYQFVVLNMTYHHEIKSYQRYANSPKLTVLTLINEQNYLKFKDKIIHQHIAGFAASDQPVPPFTKNLDDLKKIYENIDLDKIDLTTDPKFTAIRAELGKLQPLPQWTAILVHAMSCPLDSLPGKKWQTKTTELVEKIPPTDFQSGMLLIMDAINKSDEWFLDDEKLSGLRGLTWMCRLHADSNLLYILQKVADRAYKKITGGPLNAKLGNIALETISKIGTMEAYGTMGNLEAKAKYSVYKRAIGKYMKKFATLLKNYSKEDLEDMVIPTHELKNGQKSIAIGDYQAHLVLEGLKTQVTWENADGKITKAVPAALKIPHASDIKGVKAAAKSIEETLIGQTKRLEKTWLRERKWSFANWKTYYAKHDLMQFLVKKLIWLAETEEGNQSFITAEKGFINAQNEIINIPENATIRLWHPALATVQEVLDWRTFLFDQQIKQPFKQAFREVYLLTPAEEEAFDHSNRFAGHFLKGNTLYSLGKTREWKMTYDQAPQRFLPNGDLVAELHITGGVLYSEATTGQLIFKDWNPAFKQYEIHRQPKKPLAEVPPVILSEVMRDVDLFVAVASITVDPYFDQNHTGQNLQHWRDVSFGEKSNTPIAEVRKDLLGRLLPMTKIAKKVKIEGNYLIVEGKLCTYKINFSSGNILMLPNDQYLCIVPARSASLEKKIWLPFEGGDQTLMVILSKAFLLAADDKITDPSIVGQINR